MPPASRAPALPWRFLRRPWERRHSLGGWFVPLELLGVMALFGGGGYILVARVNAWRGETVLDLELALDRAIPFLDWSVFVYVTLYVYFVLPALVTPRDDHGLVRLFYLHTSLLAVTLFSFVVFLALPCEIRLLDQLPAELYEGGLTSFAYRAVHTLDRPWNAWPSLHVSLSVMIAFYVTHERRGAKLTNALLWSHWVLLAASITTTKQHHLVDLGTGAMLGVLVWYRWLRPGLRYADTAPVVGPPTA